VKSDGTVTNSSGNTIGKVTSSGDVRNASGNSIGFTRGSISQAEAAAFYFFFFTELL
jgi:hypothetical protein